MRSNEQYEASKGVSRLLLLSIGSLLMLAALDQTIVSTALPSIMANLGGLEKMSWVVTAYLLTSIVAAPIYGKMGDLFGRKVVMQLAVISFLLGSILSGISSNLSTLIASRAIQGIGGGGLFVLALTLAADLFPPRERGKIQGLFASVFGISSILGPVLGGFFVDNLTWHWIFFINIPICILALIIFQFGFKIPEKRKSINIDYKGAFFLSTTLCAFVFLASFSGKEIIIGSNLFFTLILILLLSFILFIFTELNAVDPILPLHFFKLNNFSLYIVIGFLSGCILLSTLTFTPIFLQIVKGYSPTLSGLQILPLTIGIIASTSLSGMLISRIGKYKYLPFIGSVFLTISLLCMSNVTKETNGYMIGFILLFLGTGLGPQLSVVTTAVQNCVSQNQVGTATAALTMFRQIGSTFGVAIFSAVFISTVERAFSSGKALTSKYVNIFEINPESISNMAPPDIVFIQRLFSMGTETVFFCLALVSISILIASLLVKEIPLRG